MHSLADCPLRTFCCITTADTAPFNILTIDSPALDLILSSTKTPAPLSPYNEEDILAERRSKALHFLQGRPINDLLLVDHESCLVTTEQEFYTLNDQLLRQLYSYSSCNNSNNSDNISTDSSTKNYLSAGFSQKTRRTTRRLHGCVHSSAISLSSLSSPSRLSSHSPLFHSSALSSSSTSRSPAHLQELQLQDQIVPSWEEESPQDSSMDRSLAESQACRVYVLKDVTEMHNLALAAKTDALRKERASAAATASSSISSAWTISPHTTTTTTTTTTMTEQLASAAEQEPNVTRQKLYCSKDNLDWSTSSGHSSPCHLASASPVSSSTSPCSCSKASSLSPSSSIIERQPEDPGLLLLHVTRFGTIDHSIFIPQQSIKSNLLHTQGGRMVTATTNTSVMSYVHPDDTRALCQGLDRACKALYTVFRVRWRLVGQDHLLESDRQHSPLESSKVAFVRSIEFQGESFEEYVDPTAVPDASLSSRVSNDGHTLAKYLWTEITGFLSNSQPLLVVRPLTTTELLDQANEAALATAAAAAAAASSSMITSSRRSNARSLLVQEKKGWKKKSKRMDLEEGLRLPKQINLSALTSLSMTSSSRHDELCLRMPGSLPLSVQQQQPSQQLMTATTTTTTTTRCRNPSGHANPMPSFLAFPSNATLPWSGMFVTIALDAWRQWILTVHAGQAQFQAWCEYLLEKTIDQMIESLSLGLTLLGIEEAPRSGGREDGMIVAVGSYRHHHQQQQQQQQLCVEDSVQHKTKRIEHKSCDSTNLEPSWTSFTITDSRQHQEQKAARNQQTLSGLNRAGKILEAYPSIEGVVRNIGNTWLGQKIKSRLEQKLDVVADQVVDWWEAGAEVHLAGWSPLKRAATPNGGGGGVSGAVVSELDESDVLLADAPVVVGVPTL